MQLQRSYHTSVWSFFHPSVQDDIWTRSTLHFEGSNGGSDRHSRLVCLTVRTFIQMYSVEKPLHVLQKFSLDKLLMLEVSYHISVGLSTTLYQKKKAPWPTLLLRIGLYEIHNFKHADVEAEEIIKYSFDTQSFNPYDLHYFVKDHYTRVQFQWIHGAFHWVEEDPLRYFYSFSRPN